ncbi:hypothetical protein [Mariprofundus sp. KV]|nr:hypothetical protein [Mariprofundus sp. KV]
MVNHDSNPEAENGCSVTWLHLTPALFVFLFLIASVMAMGVSFQG